MGLLNGLQIKTPLMNPKTALYDNDFEFKIYSKSAKRFQHESVEKTGANLWCKFKLLSTLTQSVLESKSNKNKIKQNKH